MRTPPYPSDLTDEEWSLLESLVPATSPKGRPRQTDMREVVNTIFYLNRAGCPWRMLPRDFPPWRTVYNYFETWKRAGVWAHPQRYGTLLAVPLVQFLFVRCWIRRLEKTWDTSASRCITY